MEVEELLERLISIDSVFGNEGKIGEYLESYLKEIGFSIRRQYFADGRFNIFADRGKGDSILFYGHMDTVTVHGKWKSGPFRPLRQGDRLFGLGSCDMKGGIAAMLKGIEGVRDRRIKVLLCGDEENVSKGAWTAVGDRRWFRDVKLAVSCEPGDSKKYTGGANVVSVGRRGRVVIAADVEGLSSHGANPHRGINAIDEAAKIALAAGSFRLRKHRDLGEESIFVRKIAGSSESALDLPDKAHIEFDIQLVPPSTGADARKRVEDTVAALRSGGKLNKGTKVTVRIKERETPYIDPYTDDLTDPRIRRVLSLIRDNLREPVINYGSSVADDNVLANSLGKPIVTIGPSGGNEHSQNEWVSIKSLRELVQVYNLLASEA